MPWKGTAELLADPAGCYRLLPNATECHGIFEPANPQTRLCYCIWEFWSIHVYPLQNKQTTRNILFQTSLLIIADMTSSSSSLITLPSITRVPVEIIPHLYLSSFPKSADLDPQITHILNMCTTPSEPDPTRTYLNVPLLDWDNITPYIPVIVQFIESGLQHGSVLVHCALGINRSASAVVAYLCHRDNFNSTQALRLVQERKNNVAPSALFLNQIDRFFGRVDIKEDPLVAFHERLRRRKQGNVAKIADE